MIIVVIGWIVFGLVAGYITSTQVNKSGEKMTTDIMIAIAGAVLGGWLFTTFSAVGVTGFSVWNLIVPVVGAVIPLWIWHTIRRAVWHA